MRPTHQRHELETSYSPRRKPMFVVLSALSALFAVAGVVAFATTFTGSSSDPQSPTQTPRDLVTDGLGGPIAIETQAPTGDLAQRSTAVVHAATKGIELVCDTRGAPIATGPGSTFDHTCAATSFGGFEGAATFVCGSTSWLTCEVYPQRADVSPDDGASFGVSVKLGPLAPAGAHALRIEARTGSLSYDTQLPFTVKPTGVIGELPTFACDAWSALVHPGGVLRVPCEVLPRAYGGAVSITCLDTTNCLADPSTFVTTGTTAPMPFELVLTTPYDALPGDVTHTVRMTGGSGQLHPFVVEVPAVVGKVDVDCPPTLDIPRDGTTPLHCTLTSTDGFDGYVRVSASAILPVGSVGVEPVDVRVPAGETVDVTVPVVSSGLPLAPLVLSLDLTPEAWSTGSASVALDVTP